MDSKSVNTTIFGHLRTPLYTTNTDRRTIKLTNITVEKAKYKGENDRLADGNHLYLRVYRSNEKAYQHQDKRAGHKVSYITLGDAGELSLKRHDP